MKTNVGSVDKVIRIVVSIALVVLFFTGILEGIVGIIGLVLAGVFTLTALVGVCPLYMLVGVSTCPVKSAE